MTPPAVHPLSRRTAAGRSVRGGMRDNAGITDWGGAGVMICHVLSCLMR